MDLSICLVTPAMQEQRSANAFDRGDAVTDHHMNPHTSRAAICDWTRGYRRRQLECMRRPLTVQQLDHVSPP